MGWMRDGGVWGGVGATTVGSRSGSDSATTAFHLVTAAPRRQQRSNDDNAATTITA